ncbi:MAG: tetrahydrofolate dehydrogenase/cyclohydrolase catalytic domain-containing protein [Bacillota bacterium]|nr:tetrahydrofolate dehydrogenase/cyclohydrolase catalytic domain-containing protein [Bacillota bacterium]
MDIIDGKAVAQKYKDEIADFVQKRVEAGLRAPSMVTILVGNDGGSIYYMSNQKKLCEKLGVKFRDIVLDENISEDELLEIINKLNQDEETDAIMLLVPLPKHINEKKITSFISYKKDIDGLTDINCGRFYKGEKSFIPCTPKSVLELIKSTGINISGKNTVVLGRSNIVGKPVAQLLLNENATVTICHSKTQNLKEICSKADILVAAIGRPGFVTADYIKEGAIVIDVGTTMIEGKVKGDVNFEEVSKKADYITPVPGGVGSLTTTMLIKNVCEASMGNVY